MRSEFVCQQCGYKSSSYLGKCPECGEWNSLVEQVAAEHKQQAQVQKAETELIKLSEVKSQRLLRIGSGFFEFDRVLGGGIVPGSIVLISGDPGIGKSTLLLQAAMAIARGPVSRFLPASARSGLKSKVKQIDRADLRAVGNPSTTATPRKVSIVSGQMSNVVLYVTGEESAQQVKIRADRIGKTPENLYVLPQTDVDAIVAVSEKLTPTLLICDSIQTLTTERLSTSAGSIGQVRECAQILQKHAKASGIPIFIVGHVTKEGAVAGPKVLEHLVDAVLNLEGDGLHAFRILRSIKNRFGSTFEVGVFEMADSGMVEVSNPSAIFLSQRITQRSGSIVTSTLAGGRPLLAEVQALCTSTIFPSPTRRVTGLDYNRIQVVIAALSRSANLSFANLDIYVNVAGGLKINEPAADLPAALAITSAAVDKPVREGICAYGEVGLLGELRRVGNLQNRMKEAKRLGFGDFVTPDKFKTLEEAIGYAIHGG